MRRMVRADKGKKQLKRKDVEFEVRYDGWKKNRRN